MTDLPIMFKQNKFDYGDESIHLETIYCKLYHSVQRGEIRGA